MNKLGQNRFAEILCCFQTMNCKVLTWKIISGNVISKFGKDIKNVNLKISKLVIRTKHCLNIYSFIVTKQ